MLMKDFPTFVDEVMRDWQVPGAAIAIVKDGQVVLAEGFGVRNVTEGLPVTPSTVFGIASCTKAFTTMAMGILVDEGKLAWDTPVRAYLPNFRMADPFATERLTPRDLITHRSGLPRHDFVWYNAALTPESVVARLPYLDPSADFRSIFQYQNLMYMTAGYLVSSLTGNNWEEVVEQRIFRPLAMRRSVCSLSAASEIDDRALPYHHVGHTLREMQHRPLDHSGPAGGIYSTITDLIPWLLLHLNHGRSSSAIISAENLREMHTPQVVTPSPAFPPELSHVCYGLGWNILAFHGHTMLRHGGEGNGFCSMIALLPQHSLGVAVLTNVDSSWFPLVVTYTVCEQILGLEPTLWSQRLKDWVATSQTTSTVQTVVTRGQEHRTLLSRALEAYIGTFEHPAYGIINVSQHDDQLRATFHALPMTLLPVHDDVFDLSFQGWDEPRKATFEIGCDGNMSRLYIPMEPAVRPITFTHVPDQ
jgi:CubicO group peptidase (beta-lactamase class C family)